MNTRTIGREIAYLTIGQISKNSNLAPENLIMLSTRTLKQFTNKNLAHVKSDLQKLGEYFFNKKIELESDLESPRTVPGSSLPVDFDELLSHIERLEIATHNIKDSLYVPELINAHPDSYEFAVYLLNLYKDNKSRIQEIIAETLEAYKQKQSIQDEEIGSNQKKGWSLDRILLTDRTAIKLGATEILHTEVPIPVAIDEIMNLVSKYSSEQSPRFVNGVLTDISKLR